MAGKLWIIEGTDGAGKATQAKLLIDKLNKSDLVKPDEAHLWTFPNYKVKPFGPLLRDYLNGFFGGIDDVSPYFACMLYALDRWQDATKMQSILELNDWIVCDRYTTSNIVFQPMRIREAEAREKLIEWVQDLEYNRFKLPKPNGVIFLSLPPEYTLKRTQERRKLDGEGTGKTAKKDIHEDNELFVRNVFHQYHILAKRYGWHTIDCVENNRELAREEIAEKVWDIVSKN
jgi:dTMP kinase